MVKDRVYKYTTACPKCQTKTSFGYATVLTSNHSKNQKYKHYILCRSHEKYGEGVSSDQCISIHD